MIVLQGKGVSEGIAKGRLEYLNPGSLGVEKKAAADTAGEILRFNEALKTSMEQLDALAAQTAEKLGGEHSALFEIHRMMLEDSDFVDPIVKIIETEQMCAEYAVETAGAVLAGEFAEMDDGYMSARAADISDVTRRLVAVLLGAQPGVMAGKGPAILAADDFTPSETAQFERGKALALLSRAGSANSHTAIFARTMGIPAIIGLGGSLSAQFAGRDAAIDGETGVVYIEPDQKTIDALEQKQTRLAGEREALQQFRGKETRTRGGRQIKLYANIGSTADTEAALANDAEGIGLFRSEFLYLNRKDFSDEDLQYESYKKVAEDMNGREVVIRTLDIGSDKRSAYFALPREENPALGMRGIRVCLARPDWFKTQLRAIYRASAHGNIAIMFPMISGLSELRRAKAIAGAARAELAGQGFSFNERTPVGIMIETPASAIISDLLAEEADFFSVGANDLTQYTLAMDRQNETLNEFLDTRHEAILRLIRMTVGNAHRAGIRVGICGTLGADPALTEAFIAMGIDELSVEPSSILQLRSRIAAFP
jgi:phosphotransferase system enzyme I (PtsI)